MQRVSRHAKMPPHVGVGIAHFKWCLGVIRSLIALTRLLDKADPEVLRLWDAPVRTPGLRWGV